MPDQELKIVVRLKDFATKELKSLSSSAKAAFKDIAIGAAAIGAVGLGGATGLLAVLKKTADAADHIGDLSRQLGVSVEALGELEFAAQQSGVTLEDLETGLKTLNKSLGELKATGEGPAAEALNALSGGLRQLVREGAPTEEIFAQITRELKDLSVADRALVSSQLFGKSGSTLLRLATEDVDALRERFRQLGGTITKDLVKSSDEFNDSLNELGVATTALGKDISAALLPEVTKLTKALTDGIVDHRADIIDFFGSMASGAGIAGAGILDLISPLVLIQKHLASIRLEAAGIENSNLAGQLKVLQGQFDSLTFETSAFRPGEEKFFEQFKAQIGNELEAKSAQLKVAQEAFERAKSDFGQLSKLSETAAGDKFQASMEAAAVSLRNQAQAIREISQFMGPLQAVEEDRGRLLHEELQNRFAISREMKRTLDLTKLTVAEMKEQRDFLRDITGPISESQSRQLADLQKELENKDLFEGLKAGWSDVAEEAKNYGAAARAAVKSVTDAIAGDATDALFEYAEGAKSAKQAFKDFARSVLKDIARIIVQSLILKVVQSAVGGIGGAISSIGSSAQGSISPADVDVASAKGNVFQGGTVVPFARGGIVSRPEFFPLRGGRVGLRGEAGPEGILPLARDSQGRLGVRSQGGGGTMVNINVQVSQPEGGSFEQARKFGNAVGEAVLVKLATDAAFRGAIRAA